MSNASAGLLTRDSQQDVWVPGKFSEVIVEFAQPLLTVDPEGPPDIEALRNVMSVAALCWNGPMWEVQGNPSIMKGLQPLLMTAPGPVAAALREMLTSRLTRYAGVPNTILVEITGTSLDDARCVARALVAPVSRADENRPSAAGAARSGVTLPLTPTPIRFLAELFPVLAEQEQEVWRIAEPGATPGLPEGTYVLRERYCAEPRCDCQRVMLYVEHVEGGRVIATLGYGFEPPAPPYDRFERQIELDWLNPQSELSEAALRRFERQIESDGKYRARLQRHYAEWKQVVEDPKHPLHAKLGTLVGGSGRGPVDIGAPKVRVNAPCPCGSGRKYKRCCGLTRHA